MKILTCIYYTVAVVGLTLPLIDSFFYKYLTSQNGMLFTRLLGAVSNREYKTTTPLTSSISQDSRIIDRRRTGRGFIINEKIISILTSSHNRAERISDLKVVIANHQNELNHVHAITMLHRSAKMKLPIELVVPLGFIVKVLQNSNPRIAKPSEIAQILYGLRLLSIEESPDVVDLLKLVNAKLALCSENFNGKEIASSLYGLQKLTSSHPEVATLLKNLLPKLKNSQSKMNGQEISNALFGIMITTTHHLPPSYLIPIAAILCRLTKDGFKLSRSACSFRFSRFKNR